MAVIVVTLDLWQEGGSSGGATATVLAIASSRGGHFEGGAVGPATTPVGAGLSSTPWHHFGYNRPVNVRPLAEPGMVQQNGHLARCKRKQYKHKYKLK